MSKFFNSKPVKIIICVLLVISIAVAVANVRFANRASSCQMGVTVCDKWSKNMEYTADYAQNIEIGNKEAKILCITDVHLRNWASFAACLGVNNVLDFFGRIQIKRLINKVEPDLIIVTGDTVLNALNDIYTQEFVDFMEQFNIPWAPVFGNHDMQGRADKSRLCEIYMSGKNCLFKVGPDGMNGMGNYILNITRDGKPVYSFFMFDDGEARIVNMKKNGEDMIVSPDGTPMITDGGIGKNQIDWYEWAVDGIKKQNGNQTVPNMAFMHVPVPEYKNCNENYIMGDKGEDIGTAKVNDGFFQSFKNNGGTHIFSGHDHVNNFITEYDGVTLGYITKSSYNCYFSFDCLGGTLLTLKENNTIDITIEEF